MFRPFLLLLLAAIITIVSKEVGWNFVWKHERGAGTSEERKISERIFWLGFSYLFPLLPLLAYYMGPNHLNRIGPMMTNWAVGIFSFLLLFITTGLSMSGIGWYRKQTERKSYRLHDTSAKDALPDYAMIHFRWTSALAIISSLFWWIIFILWVWY